MNLPETLQLAALVLSFAVLLSTAASFLIVRNKLPPLTTA